MCSELLAFFCLKVYIKESQGVTFTSVEDDAGIINLFEFTDYRIFRAFDGDFVSGKGNEFLP